MTTLKSLLPPHLAALLPTDSATGNYILTSAEELNFKRLSEGTFESDIPAPPVHNFSKEAATLPPRSSLPPSEKLASAPQQGTVDTNHRLLAAKDRVSKRVSRIRRDLTRRQGPQGETLSSYIVEKVLMLPLDNISEDKHFRNVRLTNDSDEMMLLMESMKHEGLKLPVAVIPIPGERDRWYIRSGFRRVTAARLLKWRHIPAIVLPVNTPEEDEYWANIIENSARQNLHSYEIAKAAQTMRDLFHVNYKDFARKAGYDDGYIDNLLRAIDRLPDPILEKWRNRARIPVACYVAWSSMLPTEAINSYNVYAGLHPKGIERITTNDSPPTEREPKIRKSHLKTANTYGLTRMQTLRQHVEAIRDIDETVRRTHLWIIDYCMGATDNVPGIYDHRATRLKIANRRRIGMTPPNP